MDSAAPTNTANPPAPVEQAPAAASGQQATPAPVAGEDTAALKAQLDSLLKWKASAEADLKKTRDAKRAEEEKAAADKAALEAQLREQGKFAELAKQKEDEARALAAQLAELSPKAERLTAHEQRVAAKLEAAKAKGDLPSYLVRAIDAAAARDVDEAADILDEFRASQASAQPAPKQPAPPAPTPGGAPPSPAAPVNLSNPSVADLQRLKAEDPARHRAFIFGGSPAAAAQSIAARLTGAGKR